MDGFERWELDEQLRHVARLLGPEYLAARRTPKTSASDDAWSWTDWLAMTVGFCALIVGGVLSAGDLWGRNANLWRFGLPVALMGLAALVVGLWQPSAGPRHGVSRGGSQNSGEKPQREVKMQNAKVKTGKCPMRGTRPRTTEHAAGSPGRRIIR